MTVITRFAPSPTGFLHIGGARTAYFNWLFAKHHKGKFFLRVEDTDRQRSTQEATDAILEGMHWLGLNWDDEVVYQFSRRERHADVALELLAKGNAYKCFATAEELEAMREEQKAKGLAQKYDGRWRERDPASAPKDAPFVIRLRAEQTGETTIEDRVQGSVTVKNDQLDDMILLRSDGTPTYMLSVVVDDFDMGVTHVIRGDDHLNNAFRQLQIIKAMGWPVPIYAHIPLIHGADGAKLSKRHGALGVEAYKDLGYLPETMKNYLLRMGWSHGDDEFITSEQATEWFSLDHVGKSPSRFDLDKLNHMNAHYMMQKDDQQLFNLAKKYIEQAFGHDLTADHQATLIKAMPELKKRAKTLLELAQISLFLIHSGRIPLEAGFDKHINAETKPILAELIKALETVENWQEDTIKTAINGFLDEKQVKLKQIGPALRIALSGTMESPPLFFIIEILGKSKTIDRLRDII